MRFTLSALAPFAGADVLSLADAKAHLRVNGADEDVLIAALRDAAIDWVERFTGVGLTVRGFEWVGDGFEPEIELPMRPVATVNSVSYIDTSGVAQTLAGAAYRVGGGRLMPAPGACWPGTIDQAGAVTISFSAGLVNASSRAPALVHAVRLLLGHYFLNREAVIDPALQAEAPLGVRALCASFRLWRV